MLQRDGDILLVCMRQCRHDAQSTSWRGGRSGEHAGEATGEVVAHIAHGVT